MRVILAFLAAAIVTFVISGGFYTQQVLAEQAAIGATYTPPQTVEAYWRNYLGLLGGSMPSFAMITTIAMAIGFAVAAPLKRVLKPLAPVAYPIAGAASLTGVIWIIENAIGGGGVGAIGGARGVIGMALQGVAGAAGGFVFDLMRPKDKA